MLSGLRRVSLKLSLRTPAGVQQYPRNKKRTKGYTMPNGACSDTILASFRSIFICNLLFFRFRLLYNRLYLGGR